jgi:hypothetical protein
MSKNCAKCGVEKKDSEFSPLDKNKSRTKASCKSCRVLYGANWYQCNKEKSAVRKKQWRRDNPNKARSIQLKHRYGISYEDYEEMANSQGLKCAICLRFCPPTDNGVSLVVDHCHDTGSVRELLCSGCNKALGSIGDNAEIASRMATYLNKHRQLQYGDK